MKKLPLGIQNFRKIIEGGYAYVDKTQYVYNLINGAKHYFLSRPRRFGKSLLLDTISEAFSGDRELFCGLWIHSAGYGFEKHPVVRLDMSNIASDTPEILRRSLEGELKSRMQEEALGIGCDIPSDMFKTLIKSLHKKYGKRVVVLIDEYDKPILDHLDDIGTAEANRKILRGFYGVLKSMDPHIRLTFITGVTKLAKTSMSAELNNLFDITLTKEYANICGIEAEDLEKHFGGHIENLAAQGGFGSPQDVKAEIMAWYDGYSWDGESRVVNPFSLLSFFMQKRFASFWYASGTPKFLMDLIKERPGTYAGLESLEITELMLDLSTIEKISVELLLFQTGYLTVKEVQKTGGAPIYLLGMPNSEVREAFNLHILSALTESGDARAGQAQIQMRRALQGGSLQKVLEMLRGLFASIPFELHVDREAYYHSVFYAVMNALGFDMGAEVSVSGGRVDAELELEDKVYVMEFKYVKAGKDAPEKDKEKLFEKALDEGMRQIKEKGYAKKYAGCGKTVHLAAFAFLGRDEIEMRVETL